jgi:hypothetical protein
MAGSRMSRRVSEFVGQAGSLPANRPLAMKPMRQLPINNRLAGYQPGYQPAPQADFGCRCSREIRAKVTSCGIYACLQSEWRLE